MNTVITGASGQLGRRVAEILLDDHGLDPSELVLVSRSPDKVADLAARGADVRPGDFDDPASLAAAFAGGERLLLISTDVVGDRIRQHTAAVTAAAQAGVRHIAYTSFVNATADNPAAITPEHRGTEAAIEASGLTWTFLRNSIYAEMQVDGAAAALATGALVTNTGSGAAAYVAREDCAAAAAAVLAGPGHENRAYDITGPELIDAHALAALYTDVGGRPVAAVLVDDAAFAAGLVEHAGLPQAAAELIATFGQAVREGFLGVRSDDVEHLTGRRPLTQREVLESHRAALTLAA